MKNTTQLTIKLATHQIKKEFENGKLNEKNKKILQEFSKLKNNKKDHQDQSLLQLINFNKELENALQVIKLANKLTTIINNNS